MPRPSDVGWRMHGGRVAQRESTPFTREGSQVQSLSRPPVFQIVTANLGYCRNLYPTNTPPSCRKIPGPISLDRPSSLVMANCSGNIVASSDLTYPTTGGARAMPDALECV